MSDDLVRPVAGKFGLQATEVRRVSGGFSGAAVYQVRDSEDRLFAVRCTPLSASIPEDRLSELHQLLALMQSGGLKTIAVPISRPPVANGQTLSSSPARAFSATLTDHLQPSNTWMELRSCIWQVEPWMPGFSLSAPPSSIQLENAFHGLCDFHRTAQQATVELGESQWFFCRAAKSPGLERRKRMAEELTDGQLLDFRRSFALHPDQAFRHLATRVIAILEKWLPVLVRQLRGLAGQEFLLQPVIRDLWRPHVLFEDDQLTGLIDLSAMASDHVCFDLTRLLRSWFGSNTDAIRSAVELFDHQRPLDSRERALAQVLDASTALLSPVTWLRRRLDQPPDQASSPEVLARLTGLVEIAEQFQPL